MHSHCVVLSLYHSPLVSIPDIYRKLSPFECRNVFEGLAGLGEQVVSRKALIVQQLPHGDVRQLLHQFERVVDVEEHGEVVLCVPSAYTHALGE